MKAASKSRQAGATAVEFALVMVVFLTFLLGITDFARMLYTWNAAAEATRAGARYAVVCDDTGKESLVLARMQRLMPQINSITVEWTPSACLPTTCEGARVKIVGLNYHWISPIAGLASLADIPMPTFDTYLPREVMRQDANSVFGAGICL